MLYVFRLSDLEEAMKPNRSSRQPDNKRALPRGYHAKLMKTVYGRSFTRRLNPAFKPVLSSARQVHP